MEKMKTYFVVWLCGWVACLITLERWRRLGARNLPDTANSSTVIESDADVVVVATPPAKPSASTLLVAGAKADYARGRQLLGRVVPWSKSSAATPEGTATAA